MIKSAVEFDVPFYCEQNIYLFRVFAEINYLPCISQLKSGILTRDNNKAYIKSNFELN